ncbi:galactose-3-O-sulfotransferase 2-like [Mobula birostris]|uniref:galactose-3-O-sulfotransferase 2-like n=1 Tax=Mobula birostris TaxID=1983395 RepID=UPI003B28C92D
MSRDVLCIPRKHLVFLKIHKAASSTVLNILYRYGEARNMTLALPFYNHLGCPKLFKATYVKDFDKNSSKEYNILCNHMKFNLPEVKKVMPRQSSYFTILRNPNKLAESACSYFHTMTPAFREAKSLDRLLSRPDTFYKLSRTKDHYARNLMWFDLGQDPNAQDDPDYVNNTLLELERTFHLVMLAEYFNELLVLLREALCWQMEDMVYIKLNVPQSSSVSGLPPTTSSKLQEWNSLGWILDRHFNSSFWQRVAHYGQSGQDAARRLLPPETPPPTLGHLPPREGGYQCCADGFGADEILRRFLMVEQEHMVCSITPLLLVSSKIKKSSRMRV